MRHKGRGGKRRIAKDWRVKEEERRSNEERGRERERDVIHWHRGIQTVFGVICLTKHPKLVNQSKTFLSIISSELVIPLRETNMGVTSVKAISPGAASNMRLSHIRRNAQFHLSVCKITCPLSCVTLIPTDCFLSRSAAMVNVLKWRRPTTPAAAPPSVRKTL